MSGFRYHYLMSEVDFHIPALVRNKEEDSAQAI